MTTPGRPSGGPPTGPVLPGVTLPKPGSAVRGLGEKFSANPVTGSASLSVALTATAGRSGFGPQLALAYDSMAGQSVFGYGWRGDLPAITRQTDRGVPRYTDQTDVFLLSGSEDLVAVLPREEEIRTVNSVGYRVERYRPRIEASDSRIERWTNIADQTDVRWRVISGDNVTSWFGCDPDSRIADPADPARIFSWLVCESHDDKGNVMVFEYKHEDGSGVDAGAVQERHRTEASRGANLHLKRIRYGNVTPYYPRLAADTADELPAEFHFEFVLDYGEHDAAEPTLSESQPWSTRDDPYSTYRAGFEIRTYRLCRRALMFHRFPELGDSARLVLSTDLTHEVRAGYSFLGSVTRRGYDDGQAAAMPPLTMTYQAPQVDERVHEVPRSAAPNLPHGFDDETYYWTDLGGEGTAGVLALQRDSWWFSRNMSPLGLGTDGRRDAAFSAAQPVPVQPSDAVVNPVDFVMLDVDGSGVPGVIRLTGNTSALARRADDGSWRAAAALGAVPSVRWGPDQVQFADLTGDGLPDLVADNSSGTVWYECLGTRGFAAAMALVDGMDGAALPRLTSRDRTELVQFADVTGDGLPDLVRIRNGSVRYQPNLGHGRFGAAVSMGDAPWFDASGLFDPGRLLLADIDGTGPVDLVYLAADGARLYLNHGGNRWAGARTLAGVPGADDLKRVAVVDLLGSGTACLVWSSPLPSDAGVPMRYVDLMGGVKPHLLTGYANGLGAQVGVEYQPSTYFFLRDEQDGRPWPTRLPFPVQCAHRITTIDPVRETVFVSTMTYHDGYYDVGEREFRGFGMVEAFDTESFDSFAGAANAGDPDLHQPPVLTRSWYHTGAGAAVGARLLHTRREQYFVNTEWSEHELPEPDLPAELSDAEFMEAARALKGVPLRSEVYSLDGSPLQSLPYSASELAYEIRLVQHRGDNRNASFRVVPTETVSYAYDRVPSDPRVTHSLVLEVDELGMVRRSASVVYPRQKVDAALPESVRRAQARRHITYSEHDYTADVSGADVYRLRACFDSRAYELMGEVVPSGLLTRFDLADAVAAATRVPYEELTGEGLRLRLIDRWLVTFLADDLSAPLTLGTQQSLGLIDRTHRLALTDGLITGVYAGEVPASDLTAAGYVADDGGWWVRSGEAVYSPDAPDHFYLPVGYQDAFGLVTSVEREHDLLTSRVTNPLGHVTSAVNDYRVMGPVRITDPNGNHSSVKFDPLGVVVAAAVSGKDGEGDSLGDPTSTVEYDLFQQPAKLVVRSREEHGAGNERWQETHVYLDGSGSAVMTKTQAPPGLAKVFDAETGTVHEVDTGAQLRWIGNGRTIFDNRGAPVKQYEPYFSTTSGYESEAELTETGVTPVIRYDPVGRVLQVDLPDGTFSRMEHGAWVSRGFDANDTVEDSLWFIERGTPSTGEAEPADPQRRTAWLAAAHAGTPSIKHFDSLGRVVLSIADNGAAGQIRARSESDLTGHIVTTFDNRDRVVATATTDLLGNAITASGAERGQRWMLADVAGVAVRVWDGAGRTFSTGFDAFRRPERTTLRHGGQESVVSRVVYGDLHPQAVQRNLIGMAHAVFDTAGKVTVERADFQGRPLELTRRLATDPASVVDWSGDPEPWLETETYSGTAQYDALGRITGMTLPDATVVTPTYDAANRLATLAAKVCGNGAERTFLAGEQYDAKGRRLSVTLGNGATTGYAYDPRSLRVNGITTTEGGNTLQDLAYFYDPVGNITEIIDNAQQTHFFANAVVRPDSRFTYDAVYQLVRATGREHVSNAQPDHTDLGAVTLPHLNDAGAVRRYTQNYTYDDLGNITEMKHAVDGGGWNRRYRYGYEIDPTDPTNRLTATSLPSDPPGSFSAEYQYDSSGNMITMPQVASLTWDALDRLSSADLGGGGTAHYAYGMGGGRVRKVVQRQGGLRTERRYLGAVEVYREWMNGTLRLERWTLHVSDGHGRIAQVDTLTVDTAGSDPAPLNSSLARYQYTNHIGSSTLETDADGAVISYEEYHPFGTTAYRSARPSAHHSLKRYRYGGTERDDETGLYQMGARYYAAWLGRWTSADPAGFLDGANLYAYCRNNPVTMSDPTGTNGKRGPYEYPELDRALASNPGSFQPTGEVAASGQQADIRWRVLRHPRFGRVWQFAGAVEGPFEIVVWGGPRLIRESDALARWPEARVGPPEKQPPESEFTGPPGPIEQEPPAPSSGQGGQEDRAADDREPAEPGAGDDGEEGETPGRTAGQGAVTMWDTAQRSKYIKGNKAASQAAQQSIARSVAQGNGDEALATAREVSEARNARRLATQKRLSPGGRALSQAIEGERDFARTVRTYTERLPSVEGGARIPAGSQGETARRIAVAAGESRGSLKALTKFGKVAGPVGVAVGVGLGIHAIATAPEGQRGRVAAREAGSFIGGALGAAAGMSAGVALAGGISGFLIGLGLISGPIGWLAIGLGLLGAAVVGWWWSKRGGQAGEWTYDQLAR